MRVLGITPSSTHLRLALLEGTQATPVVVPLSYKSLKLPKDDCEGQALLSLRLLLSTFVSEQNVEHVCVLRAGQSKFGRPSSTRVKAEGVIQLVAAELAVSADLVAPQSLRAREKRFDEIASGSPETVLNGGTDFSPRAWRDAVLVAWWGLSE